MSRPPTSLGGKRSPGFQPHRQACHLTTSESEEEPPSDQYLLSVFTVFSLKKKKTTKRWGKETTQKNKKKKSQHKTNDGFCFEFFLFLFFLFADGKKMGYPRHRESCPFTFPAAHNLQAARGSQIPGYTHRMPRPHPATA